MHLQCPNCGDQFDREVQKGVDVAIATLLGNLVRWGFQLVDCQSYTEHLATFGAEEWPRERFLAALEKALEVPTRMGPWTLELGPAEAAQVIPHR